MFASRRKVAPLNEEGGVSTVIARHVVKGKALYDIKNNVDGHKEYGLDADGGVLTKHDIDQISSRSATQLRSGQFTLYHDVVHFSM